MLGKVESKRSWGWQKMRRLDGITNSMDMGLSKFQETVEDRGARHAADLGVATEQQQSYGYPCKQ